MEPNNRSELKHNGMKTFLYYIKFCAAPIEKQHNNNWTFDFYLLISQTVFCHIERRTMLYFLFFSFNYRALLMTDWVTKLVTVLVSSLSVSLAPVPAPDSSSLLESENKNTHKARARLLFVITYAPGPGLHSPECPLACSSGNLSPLIPPPTFVPSSPDLESYSNKAAASCCPEQINRRECWCRDVRKRHTTR